MKVSYKNKKVSFNNGPTRLEEFNCKSVRFGGLVHGHGEDGFFNLLLSKLS